MLRIGLNALLAVAAMGLAPLAAAQDFPTKPVTVILPYALGGISDIETRLLTTHLERAWKQQVVIESRPGAGGMVGTEVGVRAAPDGYTLVMITASATSYKTLFKDVRFDILKDLVGISTYVEVPGAFLTTPKVPVKTLEEFIAYAKANPGKLNYGSVGGTGTLAVEAFNKAAGIKMTEVPFGGMAQYVTALMRGDVQFIQAPFSTVKGQVESGAIRPLALVGARRSPMFPDVPLASEKGYNIPRNGWFALAAPVGTPRPIVDKISQEMARYVASPEAQKHGRDTGLDMVSMTPDQLKELMESAAKVWAETAAAVGMKPQ
jgi:tripartite-type tricarboxylate transporter receptor subunit TctC